MSRKPAAVVVLAALAGGLLVGAIRQHRLRHSGVDPAPGILERKIVASQAQKGAGSSGSPDAGSPAFLVEAAALEALADPESTVADLIKRSADPFAAAIIFPVLAGKDPQLVVKSLRDLDRRHYAAFSDAVALAFRRWAIADGAAATAAVHTFPRGLRLYAATGVLDGFWVSSNGDLLASLDTAILLNPAFQGGEKFPPPLWVEQLAADPPVTREVLDALPSFGLRDLLMKELIAVNPGIAFEWAQTLQNQNDRRRQLRHVLKEWASSDPEAVRNLFPLDIDPSTAQSLVPAIAGNLAKSDPESALRWIAGTKVQSGHIVDWAMNAVFAEWIATDLSGATSHVLASNNRRDQAQQMKALAQAVFGRSEGSAQAIQLLDQIGDNERLQKVALEAAGDNWPTRDLGGAIAYARAQSPTELPLSFLGGLANTWAMEDPMSLAEWSAEGADGADAGAFASRQTQDQLSRAIAFGARRDAAKTLAAIERWPAAVSSQYYDVVSRYAFEQDYTTAATWLREVASAGNRDNAIAALNGLGSTLSTLPPDLQVRARELHADVVGRIGQ